MNNINSQGNGTETFRSSTYRATCPICGSKFNPFTRGRTKEYCSDHCRNINKYFSALDKELSKITFVDKKHIKKMKGDLFALSNTLKNN